MPMEICQCAKVADQVLGTVDPPCLKCQWRPKCSVYQGERALIEAKLLEPPIVNPRNGINKLHFISSCTREGAPEPRDIREPVAEARVAHLCDGCPEANEGCEEFAGLRALQDKARGEGFEVTFTVYTCRTRWQPPPILQIEEIPTGGTAC